MISIIIPVHNAESFIEETVASVKAQTYTDWELLLVENGSTDDSLRVCTRLSEGDGRIRVLQSNGVGAAAARNTGRYRPGAGISAFSTPTTYGGGTSWKRSWPSVRRGRRPLYLPDMNLPTRRPGGPER